MTRRLGLRQDDGGRVHGVSADAARRGDSGGLTDPWMSLLLASRVSATRPAPWTDVLVAYVANYQRRDGSWWFGGVSRAPFEEGHMARTALAVRVMQVYGTPAMKAELDRRIARARDYLLKARAHTDDEAAMQIAGCIGPAARKRRCGRWPGKLIAAQHADGGWGQNPNLPSDAYATGETLWALTGIGRATASDPVYRKGVNTCSARSARTAPGTCAAALLSSNRISRAVFPSITTSGFRPRRRPGRSGRWRRRSRTKRPHRVNYLWGPFRACRSPGRAAEPCGNPV